MFFKVQDKELFVAKNATFDLSNFFKKVFFWFSKCILLNNYHFNINFSFLESLNETFIYK